MLVIQCVTSLAEYNSGNCFERNYCLIVFFHVTDRKLLRNLCRLLNFNTSLRNIIIYLTFSFDINTHISIIIQYYVLLH